MARRATRPGVRRWRRNDGGSPVILEAPRGDFDRRVVAVKTGLANWEYTEVTDGLKTGERIVTSLERAGVKAGARVVPDEKSPVR